MGMWNVPYDGFPDIWLRIMEAFEDGAREMKFFFPTEKAAKMFRFDWYAFKNKLKEVEDSKSYEDKSFFAYKQIRATVELEGDKWFMVMRMRDDDAVVKMVETVLAEERKKREERKDSDER